MNALSPTSLAATFWIAMLVIQIGVTLRFLGHVKNDNRAEYDRITADKEVLNIAFNPFRIGSAYADPDLHELWGLSEPALRAGRLLRFVTILSYIALLSFVAALLYDLLQL